MSNLDKLLEELTPVLRDVVVVYILDKQGKVLLGGRKKKDKPGLGKRVGIGGGIEENEDALQATKREAMEEIGVKINSAKQVGVVYFLFPHKRDEPGYNQRCYVFTCDDWEGSPIESEVIKPEWYPIDELPEQFMWPDNLLWVPQVLKGENVNGIFLYEEGKVVDYKLEQ
ncbi:MAG: NUDIX domain-containing protein [Candidatus Dojkabacteria bacterium]